MIDFGIQLNDDSLATHVYVVGDVALGSMAGDIGDIINETQSRGVATLTQAAILGFISGSAKGKIGNFASAYDFLKHYGARPHKEDYPIIRSSLYEFLLAWQRFMQLWAGQFATRVQFTFQPEIMAGGLIEFPDHDVQMFVESVTHNFDYTEGFTTEAVLSSPALTGGPHKDGEKPGFALGGGINSIGLAAAGG